jgi:hypothetical protein
MLVCDTRLRYALVRGLLERFCGVPSQFLKMAMLSLSAKAVAAIDMWIMRRSETREV